MSDEDLRADGVRVLITGGTSGLGAGMAAALLAAGASVAITGRYAGRAGVAAQELGAQQSGRAAGLGMDVRDTDDVARGVDRAMDARGGLDVLVNNAGIGMRTVNPHFLSEPQPFWAVSPDGFRDLVETTLTGYFLVSRVVAPGCSRPAAGGWSTCR